MLRPPERAAYDDLLCIQWLDDRIPIEEDELRELLVGLGYGAYIDDIRFERILDLFPGGRNERLERQRSELRSYREKKRRAGMAGARARWGDDSDDDEDDSEKDAKKRASNASASASVIEMPLAGDGSSSSTSTSETESAHARDDPKSVLGRMNKRRRQLGMRRLKATDGNLRPIRARLRDYSAEQILVAWYGASVDEWVLSNNRLLPTHVLRPSSIEGYLDAGEEARRKRDGKPTRESTTKMVRWECTECEAGVMVTLASNAVDERPSSFLCGGCEETSAIRDEIERSGGPKRVGDILDAALGNGRNSQQEDEG